MGRIDQDVRSWPDQLREWLGSLGPKEEPSVGWAGTDVGSTESGG